MADVLLTYPWPLSVRYVGDNLRESDWTEYYAAYGMGGDLRVLLEQSADLSDMAWVAMTHGGEPFAVCGVVRHTLLGRSGVVWMLATPTFDRYAKSSIKMGRGLIDHMRSAYDELFNYVHAEQHTTLRWLARLGFEILPAEPYGVMRRPFHRVQRKVKQECAIHN